MITFLHGFMGHPSDWDDIRSALSEFDASAFHVKPAADWQASVSQLCESIIEPTVLVGYSMGARLAIGIAIEAPRLCDALVLISGNPGLESDDARQQRWLADQDVAARIESQPLEEFLADWYQQAVFASLPNEIRESEIRRKLNQSSSDWPSILRTHCVARQPNYWPQLSQLAMPVLVVAGQNDEKYRNIANRFSHQGPSDNVTTTIIPDCGHIVHREQPAALVQTLRDFVNLL